MKPTERSTLESLFKLSQKSLLKVLNDFLNKKYKKVIKTKDFIFAEGEIPVMLVAHCDTIFTELPTQIYYDESKNVMWSPQGLGADDRAGVYSIIKIIRSGLRPHILFTTNEELGGLGASAFVRKYPEPIVEGIKYIIELDRRGTNDCVFYECDNPDFTTYVESFGFCENWGTFSDISIICPKWKIAGVNLSTGYENEHSQLEMLHISPMLQTINKVIKMLNEAKNASKFEYIESVYAKYAWADYYNHYDPNAKHSCCHCNTIGKECDMFPVKKKDGKSGMICDKCISHFNWCQRCGEAFETFPQSFTNGILCMDCEEELMGVM